MPKEPTKPCPFCGGPGVVQKRFAITGARWVAKCGGQCHMVVASFLAYARRIDAVRAWDRRKGD